MDKELEIQWQFSTRNKSLLLDSFFSLKRVSKRSLHTMETADNYSNTSIHEDYTLQFWI